MPRRFGMITIFVLIFATAVTVRAQFAVPQAGIVVHKKAPTISEIHAYGLGKLYRDPVLVIHRRHGLSGAPWIPPGEHYKVAAFFQTLYIQMLHERTDPTTLQIGTLIGGSHGVSSVLNLLMQKRGREIIGVDRKQGKELDTLATQYRQQVHESFTAFLQQNPNATPEERGLGLLGAAERFSMPLRESLERILTQKQIQLSYEIVFLVFGGFTSPVVDLAILEMFALTKEQREKLELIAEDANKKRASLLAGHNLSLLTPRDFETIHQSLENIAQINARKIDGVLNDDQKEYAKALAEWSEKLKKEFAKEK